MKKQILITGGAGFIGSNLTKLLLSRDYGVICVDNFITGRKENIEEFNDNPNFKLIKANISQPSESYLKDIKPNYIFHLASPASPVGYANNPIETYKANSFGTYYLTEFARNIGARMVYSSTSESYGDPEVHPQVEDYWGNVNPVGPRSCYDVSKRYGEMVCMNAFWKYKQDISFVRIFNTYGPNSDPFDGRVIPSFIMQAIKNEDITIFGDGSHTRSYCYVGDLIEGLYKMMFAENLAGKYVNLGNPEEYTILETAKIIKEVTGSISEIVFKEEEGVRAGDPQKRCPDISKAKELLDWEPKISFREGLVPTIEYFKKFV